MSEPTLHDIHAAVVRLDERLANFMRRQENHEQDCVAERGDHEKRLRELEGRTNVGAKLAVTSAIGAAVAAILAWVKGHS